MIFRHGLPISFFSAVNYRFMSSPSARLEACLKNIAKPELIPVEYWKKIIWIAKDLKQTVYENGKKSLKLLESKHVTLLFTKPVGRFQLAFTLACDLLGAKRTEYHDPYFENQPYPGDSGRVLSTLTDMLVIHGLHHDVLIKVISQATVPVFSANSDVYSLHKALSDLMTFQEKFDRLNGLKLAWIGPPNSIFNSYLMICSKFDISIHYTCVCKYGAGRMSPVHRFPITISENEDMKNKFKECANAVETVSGAHIIATSVHLEEENKITLELLKAADPNFAFMHSLPRSSVEVAEEVFNHKSNLSVKTSENYLFVAMAVILSSLMEYQPKLSQPNFGVNSINAVQTLLFLQISRVPLFLIGRMVRSERRNHPTNQRSSFDAERRDDPVSSDQLACSLGPTLVINLLLSVNS